MDDARIFEPGRPPTEAAAPSRTRSLSFVLATLLVALPAMILVYLWATGG